MSANSWIKFLQGDEEAFSALYRGYFNELFLYGLKIGFDGESCKDAIQDVFYTVYTNRTQLSHIKSIEPYLLHCVKNRLFDMHNAASRINDVNYEEIIAESDDSIVQKIIENETALQQKDKIKQSLAALPPKQRKIIYLHYELNLSFNDIAALLDMKPDAVKKSTYRALQKMRESHHTKENPLLAFLLFI